MNVTEELDILEYSKRAKGPLFPWHELDLLMLTGPRGNTAESIELFTEDRRRYLSQRT